MSTRQAEIVGKLFCFNYPVKEEPTEAEKIDLLLLRIEKIELATLALARAIDSLKNEEP